MTNSSPQTPGRLGPPPATLHIVSDLATPHNNSLVKALRSTNCCRVMTWYAMQRHAALPWKEPLGGKTDCVYFDNPLAALPLFWRLLSHPSDAFLLVGYSNFVTKTVILLGNLFRRRIYYWTDHPEPTTHAIRRFGRAMAYRLIDRAATNFFVAGRRGVDFFLNAGISRDKCVNLPIFIEIPSLPGLQERAEARARLGIASNRVLLIGASRLTHDKGFDIFLQALHILPREARAALTVRIIGSGPEADRLVQLTQDLGLSELVVFLPWMSQEDYRTAIACADVFIHPARFDAYGGGTLFAMALGVPVIASDGAGSAVDRIVSEKNGILFPIENHTVLAEAISRMALNPRLRRALAVASRATAEEWPPHRGAQILLDTLSDAPSA